MTLGRLSCALMALAFLAGCSEPPPPLFRDGGTNTEGGNSMCGNGEWQCVPGSQQARECNGRGGFLRTVDCSAMGRSCITGVGCGVCRPGLTQCKVGEPNTIQTCAADGSGWIDGASCNVAGGEACVGGRCVGRCSDLGASYLGCEYWPTITVNSQLSTRFYFAVVVANPQTYDVNVRIEGGALRMPTERVVSAGQVEVFRLPWVNTLSQNSAEFCTTVLGNTTCNGRSARAPGGAFKLTSTGPVAAYQFNPLEYATGNMRVQDDFSFTNDASLLLPQNVLGRQYIVAAHTNLASGATTLGGFVTIVGAQREGTNMVRVRTRAPIYDPMSRARMLPIGEYTFELERGEALQLVSGTNGADLTGSIIDAAEPVAVYSGHECALIPNTMTPACDHMEEQLFPTTSWGRTYAVTPFRFRPTDTAHLVRVIAQRDGVMLTFDGIPTPAPCNRMLNQGEYCTFEARDAFQVRGSEAISVVQYMRGLGASTACQISAAGTVPNSAECNGDPAMVLEVPTDQYRANYNVLIPSTYRSNYINVTAAPAAMITLDGAPITGTPVPTGAGLVTYFLRVNGGPHTLAGATREDRFGIKIYGVGSYTSYAFPGGLDLAAISPPG